MVLAKWLGGARRLSDPFGSPIVRRRDFIKASFQKWKGAFYCHDAAGRRPVRAEGPEHGFGGLSGPQIPPTGEYIKDTSGLKMKLVFFFNG
jgi:hypothetical protein